MSNSDVAVIVLAAGMGTRMKSKLPKVLHPVAGKPLVQHLFSRMLPLNPKEVIAVVRKESKEIRDAISDSYSNITFATQTEQLGTGHAVQSAIPDLAHFNGVVLVLYADHPFITTETLRALQSSVEAGNAVTVLGFEPKDALKYGRLVTNNGKLERIVEFKDANENERSIVLCNSGVMAFDSTFLKEAITKLDNNNASNEYYLTDMVAIANDMQQGVGYITAEENEVMGVNSQSERAAAEAVIQNTLREKAMANGAMMISPETVQLQEDTIIAANTIIHPFVVFGEKATIEEGAEIKSFSHIENATIRKNAIIGPYARIRPGSDIGEGARIGNFVEVKNATFGAGAKANHLTYIGDANVGANANIGAGTITCNYDGFNKWQTEIGEEAFVGSNTSLVAPVKVGEYAIIAAGSTVTKDVTPNALMRNEMPQRHVDDRARQIREKNRHDE